MLVADRGALLHPDPCRTDVSWTVHVGTGQLSESQLARRSGHRQLDLWSTAVFKSCMPEKPAAWQKIPASTAA